MKFKHAAFAALISLFVPSAPFLLAAEKDAGTMIAEAHALILKGDASSAALKGALVGILDASLLILPKTDYADEFKSRIETVKKEFGGESLFTDKGYRYLSLAYRLVSEGKPWEMPAELRSAYRQADVMAQAKSICQKMIDSAQADLKAGRNAPAVRNLLAYVLMVVTPIEA